MKALVYHGTGKKSWDTVPDPVINDPADIIVQVDTTTICGSDLHVLKGDLPAVPLGRILGHEAVGTIVEAGAANHSLVKGDRVLVPAITSCGACQYCTRGMPSHCKGVGGIGCIFGGRIDGTQAEYVRVPFAETSVHKVPEGMSDDDLIFLTDIFPTGYELGIRDGNVKPGDTVAVMGVGPVGLAVVATAKLQGAAKILAIGRSRPRIDKALEFGATHGFSTKDEGWMDAVLAETDGLGVDVVVEAVGVPSTLQDSFRIVRPGGHVANAGVYGSPVSIPIQDLWIQNITFSTGLVDATTIPMFLDLLREGKINPGAMGTHKFRLDQMMEAYECFESSATNGCLKPVISR